MQELPRLPFDRDAVNPATAIAPMYHKLRGEHPVARVGTPAGDEGWLITRYKEIKELFNDPRIGRSHPDPDSAARLANAAVISGPLGVPSEEVANRARMRRLFAPSFSARRVEKLRVEVQEIVDDLFDKMAAGPQPGDFHEALSFPLPVLVICQLLGVPGEDREEFRTYSNGATNLYNRVESQAAWDRLTNYMYKLIEVKRANPGQDVFSDLLEAQERENLTDDEIAGLGAALLFAGHETTVTRLDIGTLLLLTHPEQRELLRRDPSLVKNAVEEILRAAAPSTQDVLPRYAHEDIEVGGVTIPAGDLVLLPFTAANRDPEMFDDPDTFDITRDISQHLAFGHGPRFCIGASLARVELQAVFSTVFERFPELRLAGSPNDLEFRDDTLTGGLAALPVVW
ncbi:cytochrome P450 [Streptomyces sp. NPDC059917]|uniref:cytochrome P450 n=1 Tax=Streptomyces sp. NPDC059917 TaxID=3347002 RepID=UPI00365039A5